MPNSLLGCPELHQQARVNRRGFLQLGLLGGLSLADVLRNEAVAGTGARPTSVILLWMRGGPSHIDMWDPKPEAPVEYRGEFGTMSTNVPGITITDMLPQCARIMDRWSIVRSLHHHDAGHSTGDQICFTGYNSGPNPDENIHPSCGSIIAEQLGHLNPELPAYVMIPRMLPGANSAYLGVACKPFETLADPAQPGAVLGAELFAGGRRDRRPAGGPPRAALRVRSAGECARRPRPVHGHGPLPAAGLGDPDLAQSESCIRPGRRAACPPRAIRLHARLRSRRLQPLRRPCLEPADPCSPAAWWKPGSAS